jgi:hypothetical protein
MEPHWEFDRLTHLFKLDFQRQFRPTPYIRAVLQDSVSFILEQEVTGVQLPFRN